MLANRPHGPRFVPYPLTNVAVEPMRSCMIMNSSSLTASEFELNKQFLYKVA